MTKWPFWLGTQQDNKLFKVIKNMLIDSRHSEADGSTSLFVAILRFHGVLGGQDPDLCAHFLDEQLHQHDLAASREACRLGRGPSVMTIVAPKLSAIAAATFAIAVCMSVLASPVAHAQLGSVFIVLFSATTCPCTWKYKAFNRFASATDFLRESPLEDFLASFLGVAFCSSVLLRFCVRGVIRGRRAQAGHWIWTPFEIESVATS